MVSGSSVTSLIALSASSLACVVVRCEAGIANGRTLSSVSPKKIEPHRLFLFRARRHRECRRGAPRIRRPRALVSTRSKPLRDSCADSSSIFSRFPARAEKPRPDTTDFGRHPLQHGVYRDDHDGRMRIVGEPRQRRTAPPADARRYRRRARHGRRAGQSQPGNVSTGTSGAKETPGSARDRPCAGHRR